MDNFDNVLSVNVKGTLICTRAVTKVMLSQTPRSVNTRNGTRNVGRGSIVNLGSANSYAVQPGKVAYTTSKHAMMGVTKTAGESLVEHKNRNAVPHETKNGGLNSFGMRKSGGTCQCRLSFLGPYADG